MDEPRYKKGGDAGSKGVDFQIGLLTMFLLNALQRFHDWKLTTEDDRAGKFDDVVLEWPEGAVLLQAKHKKNCKITKQDLLSTNSRNADFSLPKYFLSYQEIKKEFKGNNTLIICSNAYIHDKALEFVDSRKISTESILYCANDEYSYYKINSKILPDLKRSIEEYLEKNDRNLTVDQTVITDENLNDFMERLQIFSSFPSDGDMENVIEQLLSRKRSNDFYKKIFSLELRSKVTEWFQHREVDAMDENKAMAIFSELRTEKYWQTLEQYGVEFRHNDLTLSDSKRIYHMVVENGYLLQVIKIHHTLRNSENKILSINPGDSIEVQRQIVDTFQLEKYTVLVIIWPESTEESVKTEVTGKLRGIMATEEDKKIVLITESDGESNRLFGLADTDLDVESGSVTFNDLADTTQEKILSKKNIVFQGEEISLKTLFPIGHSEDLNRAADLLLEKLIKDDKITVGAPFFNLDENLSHLYINRTFKRQGEKRRSEKMKISYAEKDIYDVTEKIILIADTAGMGKTTVVTNLANAIKKRYPLLWVIKIKLNDFFVVFKDFSNNNTDPLNVLNLLNSKDATRLTNDLSKFVFGMEERVVLILDGVDEVSPYYTDLVINLLLQCQEASNFAKVFVTTRPHVVSQLQEKLQVCLFTLEPFTDENQISFLTNYWFTSLNLEDTDKIKCEKYARALVDTISLTDLNNTVEDHFAAIPLQLRMLAEIFQESMSSNESTDWEGCKEYIHANEEEPRLPEEINFVKLYDMFIEKKRDIFIDKENPDGHTTASQALHSQFDLCLQLHRDIAFNIVLAEENRRCFSCYGKSKDVEDIALMVGIVQKSNNEFNFIHRTLAEYYVADSIMKELRLKNHKFSFQKFLIEEVFYEDKYNIVLTFLDNFLESNLDSIPYNVFKTYKSRTSCDCCSTWKYKDNLIHKLAEKGCVAVLQLLLKCAKYIVIRDKTGYVYHFEYNYKKKNHNALTCLKHLLTNFGVNIKDDFGRTPLHYASSKGHLKMVKFLLEQGANLSSKGGAENTPLVEAAQNGQIETTKYFLKQALGIERDDVVEAVRIDDSDMETFLLEIIQGNDELNVEDMKVPYVAACMGYLGVLKASIERGTKVDSKFENGESLIIAAACGKHRDIVEYLVQNGVDINSANNMGRTALHLIAQKSGDVTIAKLLIQLGTDIHITDNVEKTALHLAASSNHFDMMKLLIGNGANVNAKDKAGSTALHEAAACGNWDCIEFLTNNDADVNITDGKGNTALLLCVGQWQASKIAKFLLDSGAKINIQNFLEQTALHVAVSREDESMVRFLVSLERNTEEDASSNYGELSLRDPNILAENGIINSIDENGRTALHLAVKKGCLPLVNILVEAGAQVNLRGKNGQTPLHVAADKGDEEVTKLLIAHGADIESTDNTEQTPAAVAKKKGHLHLLEYIRVKERDLRPIGIRILSGGCIR